MECFTGRISQLPLNPRNFSTLKDLHYMALRCSCFYVPLGYILQHAHCALFGSCSQHANHCKGQFSHTVKRTDLQNLLDILPLGQEQNQFHYTFCAVYQLSDNHGSQNVLQMIIIVTQIMETCVCNNYFCKKPQLLEPCH